MRGSCDQTYCEPGVFLAPREDLGPGQICTGTVSTKQRFCSSGAADMDLHRWPPVLSSQQMHMLGNIAHEEPGGS